MEEGKGGIKMGMEGNFTLGDWCTMQCADGMLLSCTLETCTVLLTNITPINSTKKKKDTETHRLRV